jgi:hypothetical protein
MGTKVREFAPLVNGSLEDLVLKDNVFRHVEWSLDLAFVRDLVRTAYAGSGKLAIDRMVVCNYHVRALPPHGQRAHGHVLERASEKRSFVRDAA